MGPAHAYRRPPTAWRVGFEIVTPPGVELSPSREGVRCRESRDGRALGELELSIFAAQLVIDRDGVLAQMAADLAAAPAAEPVELPGAIGYRASDVTRGELPYVYAFAVAPRDLAVSSGVSLVLRCATPAWAAAEQILGSLRLITRAGTAPVAANDADIAPALPLVAPRRG